MFDEELVVAGGFQRGDGVGLIVPVVQAVIEPDLQSVPAGGVRDLLHEVAAAIMFRAVIREPRVIHAEPFMVHGGEDDVLHASFHDQIADLVGVEFLRTEPFGDLSHFRGRDLLPVHDPFSAGEHAEQTEMHEHSVLQS